MTGNINTEQMTFLKRMNRILRQKEKELYERCRTIVTKYEKRLVKNGGDLTDYNLDIYVDFYAGRHHPRYTYHIFMTRMDLEEKEATFGSNDDWHEPG